jgi:hypothetical protein
MKKFNDFLRFRWFITPQIMPVIFWVGVFIAVVKGIVDIVWGARFGNAPLITSGIFTLILGPIFVRMLCEWFLTFFKG